MRHLIGIAMSMTLTLGACESDEGAEDYQTCARPELLRGASPADGELPPPALTH